jgi:hypothetical protein
MDGRERWHFPVDNLAPLRPASPTACLTLMVLSAVCARRNVSVKRRARIAPAFVLANAFLISCQSTTPSPSTVASGTCALEVFAVDDADPASTRPLPSPFVIDSQGDVMVVKGSGWRNAKATVTEPSGVTHNHPIDFNETNAWPMDLPGVWRFRFEDDAGCMSGFGVEVRL